MVLETNEQEALKAARRFINDHPTDPRLCMIYIDVLEEDTADGSPICCGLVVGNAKDTGDFMAQAFAQCRERLGPQFVETFFSRIFQ